jgi:sugar O-acyltransferase (sialic acid O-acetyltransferase NeuD family)
VIDVRVPREDVNDDFVTLVEWLAPSGSLVETGQAIALLETSKTVFEVAAPCNGELNHLVQVSQEILVGALLCQINDGSDAGASAVDENAELPKVQFQLTKAAEKLSIEPSKPLKGWISARDLLVQPTSAPLQLTESVSQYANKRLVLIGGGNVGLQALDILLHDPRARVIGFMDDNPQAADRDFWGVPYLGPVSRLTELHALGAFDEAVITFGLNLSLRLSLFALCEAAGIRLANAVDPSCRLNRSASLGQGNILCSFVHLGVFATLGNNNFVAAHSSIDHHNSIGSHNLFGPGCLLSGNVTVGDRCIFGSGVIVQPGIVIGDDCRIASGMTILKNLASGESVKSWQRPNPGSNR